MATPTNWDMLQAILLQLAHLGCRCLMGLPAHGTAFPRQSHHPAGNRGWVLGLCLVSLLITLCATAWLTQPLGRPCCASPSIRGEEEGWECLVGSSEDLKSASKLTGPRKQGASLLGLEGAVGPGNLP